MSKTDVITLVIGDMTAKKTDVKVNLGKFPAIMSKAVSEILSKQKDCDIKKSATGVKSGFLVTGNMMSLKLEKRNNQELIICVVSIALGVLPDDKLVPGKIEGTGGTDVSKDLQGDAEFAVKTAATEAAKTAIKQIRAASK